MTSLRTTIEADLAATLEGDFASVDTAGVGQITLTAPDGTQYAGIKGLVLYDQRRVNPETGLPIVVHEPVLVLRRSTLTRVPVAGETWYVRYPAPPPSTASLRGVLGPDRAPEGGETIGFVRLYPHDVSAHDPGLSGVGAIVSLEAIGSPVVVGV